MSSTSNAQALLVNVFRPTYRYDSNLGFVPSLTLSNVTEVITDKVITGNVSLTDSNLNTYVGCNAGNSNLAGNRENVAIGYGAMAGALNSSNNVAIGLNSLAAITSGDSNVGIGINTQTSGDKNIFIGPNITGTTGSNNIIIGTDINIGSKSNKFQLGRLLYGDLCSGFIGVNTADPSAAFDISGITIFRDKVGFQTSNPQYSLDVNGSIYASERFFGGSGTQANPLYSFLTASNTGMYQPQDVSYGSGAFGIAVNGQQAAVFASNQVYFFKNLNVAGTFSADSVVLSGITAANGTVAAPSITFSNDASSGMYLASVSNLGFSTGGRNRLLLLSNGDVSLGRIVAANGTAATPAYSFTSDASMGFYRAGTNEVRYATQGIDRVFFDNAQLGVGLNPSAALDVSGIVRGRGGVVSFTYIRDGVTPSDLDISGGNISNSGTTRSSNVIALSGTSNAPSYAFANDISLGFNAPSTASVAFNTAGIRRMTFSNSVLAIARSTLADTSLMIQLPENGYVAAGRFYLGDPSNSTTASGGTIVEGLSNGGSGACDLLLYSRQSGAGSTAPRERMRIVGTTGSVGIGTSNPAYTLDVCGTDATASVNAATWMRTGGSNVLVVRSVSNIVGNTVVWGLATQSIDTTLATYRRSPATGTSPGTSFIIQRSGMWAISAYSVHTTGTIPFWIDCSTSDISSVPLNTAGNQTLAIMPGVGTQQSLAWCGYLPSNNTVYYKFRSNGAIANSNTWHFQLAFLGESGLSVTFPQ